MDTGEARVLVDQLINCGGLGAFGLEALYWSSDSRYLFYTPAREGSPDGGCGPWYRPIVRLDVHGGDHEDLAEGILSSRGTLTASALGQELVIWSRDREDIIRIPAAVSGQVIGALAWAPNGQSLVYLQQESFCPPGASPSTLVRLDLPDGQQTVLLDAPTPIFTGVAWDDPAALRLTDADGQVWLYDLATKTLTRAPS
jgi:Tol biopolymer transport system component